MGIELQLISKPCETCGDRKSSPFKDCTYNLAPMWNEIYPGIKFINIDGMTSEESLPILKEALKVLQNDPDSFVRLNPANGWGSYDGFVEFIKDLIVLCEEYPRYTWEVWR